ncbi:MAG: hypothetical protein GDA54_05785 [Alphaproteobacteria bacterium GM7ARS4]|nr:hypothetical protein [Alphaproteobacteria bacterium GM7ARS4]
MPKTVGTTFPRCRRILTINEPYLNRYHSHDAFNQFGVVLSNYMPDKGFDGIWSPAPIYRVQLSSKNPVSYNKTKRISVICSGKQDSDYQRQRLRFVASLKEELGESLDVFGRDSHPIANKEEGIIPYRYHVALENCCHPHYWTEKIADAYMGGAYPFYSGCPNLDEYFPRESYTPIDIFNIRDSVDTVATLSASNLWREKRDVLMTARQRLIHQHDRLTAVSMMVKKLAYTLPPHANAPHAHAPCEPVILRRNYDKDRES